MGCITGIVIAAAGKTRHMPTQADCKPVLAASCRGCLHLPSGLQNHHLPDQQWLPGGPHLCGTHPGAVLENLGAHHSAAGGADSRPRSPEGKLQPGAVGEGATSAAHHPGNAHHTISSCITHPSMSSTANRLPPSPTFAPSSLRVRQQACMLCSRTHPYQCCVILLKSGTTPRGLRVWQQAYLPPHAPPHSIC
jgi:hypothetical protein